MKIQPRSLGTTIFRFTLVALLAIVILVGTTLVIASAVAWLHDARWDEPGYLTIGFVCGLIVWLFVAVFHLRRESQTMAFSQREQFINKAKTVLQEMGYAFTGQQGDHFSFRPRFQSYLFGGGITLEIDLREASITGPKVSLEIFRRCFRMMNHVHRVQQYLKEHRKFTDNVVKRAELQLRLKPDQFDAVRKNVIEVLEIDGDVICELNILVQSEHGIREETLEFQIREWFEQQGIDCDIHKDHVQFVETVHHDVEDDSAVTVC